MIIIIETAEKLAKWGNAGFGLITAIITMISLANETKDGKSAKDKQDER